jgi:hypothetical protein
MTLAVRDRVKINSMKRKFAFCPRSCNPMWLTMPFSVEFVELGENVHTGK